MAGERYGVIDEDSVAFGYAVPRKMRAYILKRDGHACRYCGAHGDGVILEMDHVNPRFGTFCRNLVTACRPCNRKKGGRAFRNASTMQRWEPRPL